MSSIEPLEYRQLLSSTVTIDPKTYASLNAGSTKSDYTGCGLTPEGFTTFVSNMFSPSYTSSQIGSCAALIVDYTNAVQANALSQQTNNTQTLGTSQASLTSSNTTLTTTEQTLQASATSHISTAAAALGNYTADNKVLLQLIADAGKLTSLNPSSYVFNDPGLAASALSYINMFNGWQIALSATTAIQNAFSKFTW